MSNDENHKQGVRIQFIGEGIGNGLFATRDFKIHEVLFEEKPLVSCQFLWNYTYGYLACDFCMRPLETSEENARRLTALPNLTLPHPECCSIKNPGICCQFCKVSYCSEECRLNAWNQYHMTLCLRSPITDPNHPIVQLQESWKQMHYPPETASIMLLMRIMATVKQATDKENTFSAFSRFCHRSVNEEEQVAHKFLGDEFKSQLEMLRNIISKIFPDDEFIYHWLTPDGFRSLIALIGTNGQGIGTSPFSNWVKRCEELHLSQEEREKLDKFIDDLYEKLENEAGCFLNSEGSGLYTLQSVCNHSCQPNAIVTFPRNNFTLCVKALRDVKAGEEICISYLDECDLSRSRHSRIKTLRENYLFTCDCPKCLSEADEEDVTSEEEMDDEQD